MKPTSHPPLIPTEQIHEVGEGGDDPVVPRLVRLVNERVHGVASDQRIQNDHQMTHGGVVIFLRLAGAVGRPVANAQHRLVSLPIEANLDRLRDLPQLQ